MAKPMPPQAEEQAGRAPVKGRNERRTREWSKRIEQTQPTRSTGPGLGEVMPHRTPGPSVVIA